MNELATIVDDYISSKGIKYQFIADKIGLSKQGLYSLMRKKNFSLDDANRILAAIDCQFDMIIKPKQNK
ncbi:helix-turn-helix domain-containing protein [Clostridium sp. HBUAS56010]|uniref:helix-turn-helix domain-containing protein n=1 Tax=Clostridium sp. HBUAS56010 TaxID=2571127 RepID=UPI001177ADA9|nr:helix-turn-helix domain-containing protein [Clostridium sp. HBUAS56010]